MPTHLAVNDAIDPSEQVRRARVGLAAWALATVVGVIVAVSPDPNPPFIPPPGATTDLEFYRRIVAHVEGGEGYYPAAHRELRAQGYPSRSVFNWRFPTYAWLFSSLPGAEVGRGLLSLGMAATVLLWCRILLDELGLWPATAGGLALIGGTSWCVGTYNFLFTELWAGMFIALSLALGRMGWRAGSVAAGLAALAFRELALPYVVLAGFFAWQGRRRREAMAWGLGVVAFLVALGCHASIVQARLTPEDLPLAGGWVRLGGVRFILTTSQTNVALMGLPLWVTAVVLPLALVGLWADPSPEGRLLALTVGAYLAAFSVVGAPFNYYWGFLFAPLLVVGLARAPSALGGLVRRVILGPAGLSPGGVVPH